MGERDPERFAEALRRRTVPAAQAKKGAILDEAAGSAGKMTPEGFRNLAQDRNKIGHFSPSEQAAIRRAGGDDLVERAARRIGRNAPSPLPFDQEMERLIANVTKGRSTGAEIGDNLGHYGRIAGGLIGAAAGTLPTASRLRRPISDLTVRAISNRNVRNAEREIRNGVRRGANIAEARRELVRALLQNEAIRVGH